MGGYRSRSGGLGAAFRGRKFERWWYWEDVSTGVFFLGEIYGR